MRKGELRNQIDGIWKDFWSGGLANPPQVIEQSGQFCNIIAFMVELTQAFWLRPASACASILRG